jgi:hypothetical protein
MISPRGIPKVMEPDYVVSRPIFWTRNTVILAASDQKRYGLNENPFFTHWIFPRESVSAFALRRRSAALDYRCRWARHDHKTSTARCTFTGYRGTTSVSTRLDGRRVAARRVAPGSVVCFDICEADPVCACGPAASGALFLGRQPGPGVRLTGMNESIQDSYALSKPAPFLHRRDGFVVD